MVGSDGVESAVRIRPAAPGDAPRLTELARTAKASWGYPPHWLAQWEHELTIDVAYMARHRVWVAMAGSLIVGMAAVEDAGDHWMLEHVWIDPEHQRRGFGRTLVLHALERARAAVARPVRALGDPNAARFYASLSAQQVGSRAAPMPGASERTLPIFEWK